MVAVALVSMLGPFTIDAYLPSFEAIETAFGIGRAAMAQTLSFYLLAFALTTLIWGPLSDSFGRRPVMLVSLVAYVITSVACALAESFPELLIARVGQGLAASGGMIIGRAVIRDAFPGTQAQRAMSHVMLLFAIAPAVAPVIGGWLHEAFGWRSVFLFLAGYGVFVIALVLFAFPETLPREQRHSIHPAAVSRVYWRALTHGRFLALVFAFSAWFGGLFLYIAGAPAMIFEHLGLEADSFAVQFVPMVLGVMLGSFLSGRLAHRWPARRTINTAFAVMLTAMVINLVQAEWLPPTPWNVIAPLVLYAFGVALAMPNITVMALDCFPRNRGMASAVQGFVQMAANAFVAGAAVPLFSRSVMGFAVGQAALVGMALLLWGIALQLGTRPPP